MLSKTHVCAKVTKTVNVEEQSEVASTWDRDICTKIPKGVCVSLFFDFCYTWETLLDITEWIVCQWKWQKERVYIVEIAVSCQYILQIYKCYCSRYEWIWLFCWNSVFLCYWTSVLKILLIWINKQMNKWLIKFINVYVYVYVCIYTYIHIYTVYIWHTYFIRFDVLLIHISVYPLCYINWFFLIKYFNILIDCSDCLH